MTARIVISQRHTVFGNKGWIDYLENTYVRLFAARGVTVFPMPNETPSIARFIETVRPQGIVLCGGEDVTPALYGGDADASSNCSAVRDRHEQALVRYALRRRLPVFGICRGMQFLNVHFGGSIEQRLGERTPPPAHIPVGQHDVDVTLPARRSRSKRPAAAGGRHTVNSFHNQGVTSGRLGRGLKPFAVVPGTDIVEGLYHARYPVAGIQWHPERTSPSERLDALLVDSFLHRTLFWRNARTTHG